MRALIFASGPVTDYGVLQGLIRSDDLIICADGGIAHALAMGLTPARVIGDFDSATPEDRAEAERRGWPLVTVPRAKDQTDTQLAVEWALATGVDEVILAGAVGGRLDHTVANLLLLPWLAGRGVRARLVDGANDATTVVDQCQLTGDPGEYLSLLPLSPTVTGVTTAGLKYPLTDATLHFGQTLGVSNEFTGSEASVRVSQGVLLAIKSRD